MLALRAIFTAKSGPTSPNDPSVEVSVMSKIALYFKNHLNSIPFEPKLGSKDGHLKIDIARSYRNNRY